MEQIIYRKYFFSRLGINFMPISTRARKYNDNKNHKGLKTIKPLNDLRNHLIVMMPTRTMRMTVS